jgi:hypothetical protein
MMGLYVIAVIVALWLGLGFVDALSRPFEKWVAFKILLCLGFVGFGSADSSKRSEDCTRTAGQTVEVIMAAIVAVAEAIAVAKAEVG